MPDDMLKSRDKSDPFMESLGDDLRELRSAVQDLGALLSKLGRKRLEEVGDEIEEQTEAMTRQGRQAIHLLEHRVGALEKRVERSLRDHPGAWAGGILGVIGSGLVLGMLARRHD